jgi:hypothetical protein
MSQIDHIELGQLDSRAEDQLDSGAEERLDTGGPWDSYTVESNKSVRQ